MTRDCTRAVLLATIMVLSVVTGSVAFAGTASAAASNLTVSSKTIAGTGTVTVSAEVSSGQSATFKIQDSDGTVSGKTTVTDNGDGDDATAQGAVETTLDLSSLFSSTPASGTARIYAVEGSSLSISQGTFDTKTQVTIDSVAPTATVLGGSQTSPATVVSAQPGDQIKIHYTATDVPQKIASATMTITGPNGNVRKEFTGLQAGEGSAKQFVVPSDWSAGEYDVSLTVTDEVGHTATDSFQSGLVLESAPSSVTVSNLQLVGTPPIKGTGTATVKARLSSPGSKATFKVQDANGQNSAAKTVTDGGDGDGSTTSGVVKASLDLGALFSSTPASGTAVVYAGGGESLSISKQTFDTKQQVTLDSTPPTANVMGSSSNQPTPVYTQAGTEAQIKYRATDVPQKVESVTMTIRRNGQTLETFTTKKDGLQGGNGQNAQFVVPGGWSEGKYDVTLTVTDEVGHTASDTFEGGFVVDNTQPTVASVMTGHKVGGPSTKTRKIVVELSERGALNPESISKEDFDVGGYSEQGIRVTKDNDVVLTLGATGTTELSSEQPLLERGEQPAVYLTVNNYVADKAGNKLRGNLELTGAAMDGLRPKNPDEIVASPDVLSANDLSSVRVGVKFVRTKSTEGSGTETLTPSVTTTQTPEPSTETPTPSITTTETPGTIVVADPPEGGTIHVRFTGPGGTTVTKTMPADTSSGITYGTFDLTGAKMQDGKVKIDAKLVDDSANTWENSHGFDAPAYVTKNTERPTVTSVSVPNAPINQQEASSPQTVTVEFSEPMDTSSSPKVSVTGLSGGPYPVSQRSYTGTTWTGTVDLPGGVDSTATVEVSGAQDSGGNTMESPYSATFEVDTLAPQAPSSVTITTAPINAKSVGSVGVDVSFPSSPDAKTLHLKFSDGTTSATREIALSRSSSGSDSGSVSIMASSSTTISKTVDLSGSGLSGSVTASAKVVDAAGNANAGGFTAQSAPVTVDLSAPTAPSTVTVTNAPITSDNVGSVGVDVTFPSTPERGTLRLTFSDGSASVTREQAVSTASKTTSATVDLSQAGLADGDVTVTAALVDSSGNPSAGTSTTVTKDTTGPTFTAKSPASGTTASYPLSSISVDVADATNSVAKQSITVSVDGGDKGDEWNIASVDTSDSRVAYTDGTLTITPDSPLKSGAATVKVSAADTVGNSASSEWSFQLAAIDSVSVKSVEHDFVGVVSDPDGTVTVEATATASGTPVESTSGGQFELSVLRNGEQVTGTKTLTADAKSGTVTFDLTNAITGTPEAGPVTVQVTATSSGASGSTTVDLTHKVRSFDSTWELMGTPMPVETMHTSGVANFYTYSPSTGYQSAADVKQAGTGYYAEKKAGTPTARVGYTFETSSRMAPRRQTLQKGWHLVGPSFDVDAQNSVAVSNDLAPMQVSTPGVVVYTQQNGDLKPVTSGSTAVGESAGYFVYIDSQRTRAIAVSDYQPSQDAKNSQRGGGSA